MDSTAKAELARLRRLYAYDLAVVKQKGESAPVGEREELEVLALHHFSTSLVSQVEEFINIVGESTEMSAAVIAILLRYAGEIKGVIQNAYGEEAANKAHDMGLAGFDKGYSLQVGDKDNERNS